MTLSISSNRIPLYSLLLANAVSGIGSTMSALAIPWFVLQTTGSAGQAGVTGAVEAIPVVLAGFFGGALVDRIGYRRTSVISDIASGLAVASIPLLFFTVGLTFWQLLVLVFLSRLLLWPGRTGRRSLVPELADRAGVPLSRANGMYEVGNRIPLMVGPPIAGVLIALTSAASVLWIDAATFGISALLIAAAIPARLAAAADVEDADEGASGSYVSDLLAGLRWVRDNGPVRNLILTVLVTNLIEAPWVIMLTVYARDVLDSSVALGVLFAAMGAGTIIGAAGYGYVDERVPRHWMLPIGFGAIAMEFGALLAHLPLGWLLAVMFISGVAAGPLNPMIDTVVQERTPSHMRGRVFGLISALAMAAFPIGVVLGGGVIEVFSLNSLIAIQCSALSLAVIWMALSPHLRDLDAPAMPQEQVLTSMD